MLKENRMFGSPAQVVPKLKSCEALAVDGVLCDGLKGIENSKRPLKKFIDEIKSEFT